eukprot:TRINITY_DN13020_c0_g1_i3.p1 TRINITY_DN13020_c0_g1~~TRINITY_DN13020_c0_g1_i3.p1  ORF type:complete len:221 (-),score=74.90 TRINITY_DN13020_c0_g1_i3:122-784(-)
MSDLGEFGEKLASPQSFVMRRVESERIKSIDSLPGVSEEIEEDDKKGLPHLKNLEDRAEFNLRERKSPFAADFRTKSLSFSGDMEEIHEDFLLEANEHEKRKSKLRAGLLKGLKVDEVAPSRWRSTLDKESSSPKEVSDVIEEERPEKEGKEKEEVRLGQSLKQKEQMSKIIRGENLGAWDGIANRYFNREVVRRESMPIPEMRVGIDDKEMENEDCEEK